MIRLWLTLILLPVAVYGHGSNSMAIVEVTPAHRLGSRVTVLEDGMQYCPSHPFTVRCDVPHAENGVYFKLNGQVIHRELRPPFLIVGGDDSGSNINSWDSHPEGSFTIGCYENTKGRNIRGQDIEKSLTIACEETPLQSPPQNKERATKKSRKNFMKAINQVVQGSSDLSIDRKNCVTRRATDFVGEMPSDWKKTGRYSLSYRPDDASHEISSLPTVSSMNNNSLTYSIQVPEPGRYAVVLDLTTSGWTDWNDVWVGCSSGLWPNNNVKVFHNEKGRSKNTVVTGDDNQLHSLSTAGPLRPGMEYTCFVAGRSSRTTLNGIVLFPCMDEEDEDRNSNSDSCDLGSNYWEKYVQICDV